MTNKKTEVDVKTSLDEARQGLANAMKAAFAGKPGIAARTTPASRKRTASINKNIIDGKVKSSVSRLFDQKIIKEITQRGGARGIAAEVEKALQEVIDSIVGEQPRNITVMGRNIGTPKPAINISQSPLGKYIKSKEGAGLIGLPDPDAALDSLKVALTDVIKVRVATGASRLKTEVEFDQQALLRRTPHPTLFEESKSNTPFISWLQLVTGPNFVKSIDDYSFVSVRQMSVALRKEQQAPRGLVRAGFNERDAMKRLSGLDALIRAPRTASYAGSAAGLMLLNRKRGKRLSAAEFAGGDNSPYQSPTKLVDYWDVWWNQVQIEIKKWAGKVLRAAYFEAIKKYTSSRG